MNPCEFVRVFYWKLINFNANQKFKTMKMNFKLIAIAFCGALALASCKKETVESTNTDMVDGDTIVTTTTTTTTTNGMAIETDSAKVRWERAKQDVKDAIARGDKKAQEAAQKSADDAETSWNKLKANVKEDADATKAKMDEAGDHMKAKYNETLENAKAK